VNSPASQSRTRYWLGVARWSLIVLLSFELIMRVFITRSAQQKYEPAWGIIPVNNSSSMQGLEGYATLHYLDNGEIVTPHQGGVSIVVLGDSTTRAAQVPPEENFVSLTETELRQDGFDVDLHNLGRSARLMSDHIYVAPAVIAAYEPDIVVVQVSLDTFTLSFDKTRENYVTDDGQGKYTLVHQDPPSLCELSAQNWIVRSGLLDQLAFRFRYSLDRVSKRFFGKGVDACGLAIYDNDLPPASSDNLSQEQELLQLRNRVVSQTRALQAALPNSRIVFLIVAEAPKIEPGSPPQFEWERPKDSILASILERMSSVRVVYTRKIFQQYYDEYKVLPRGNFNSAFNFGHLNPNGHRAVAEALTDALEEILK